MKRLPLLLLTLLVVLPSIGLGSSDLARWHEVDAGFRVFALFAQGDTLWACGPGEAIAQSKDNGLHWTMKHHRQPGATLLGMEMATEGFGYAFGTGGVPFFTKDAGETWTAGKDAMGTILMASFANVTHGLIRTRRELLFTTDGEHWTPVSFQQNAEALKQFRFTYALAALDDQHLAVMMKEGSAHYEPQVFVSTADGGKTWTAENIPNVTLYGLLRLNGEYWLEGTEVVGKDKPSGGQGVPLLMHSRDGHQWTHTKNDVSACQMELCTLCTANGCMAANGSLVRPFGELTTYAVFEPLEDFSPAWAATRSAICTNGPTLRCTDLKQADKKGAEDGPNLPTQTGIATQSTENRDVPQCLRCELDHVLVSPKAAQGPVLLSVKLRLNPDGTVGKVEVAGAPSADVEEKIRQRIGLWLFEPLSSNAPTTVQLRAQVMVIHPR
jgi:photosystem II stability/assembly factor-like uncharacterized protein